MLRADYGCKKGKGIARACHGSSIKKYFLILLHPFTNFEIQKYYLMNLDLIEFILEIICICSKSWWIWRFGTNWIALYVKNTDSFGVEHVPKEIEKFIENKNIKTNIFRIKTNNSVKCAYFCIVFVDFMYADKTLIDYTSLFSPFEFEKNGDIIFDYLRMNEVNSAETF